MRIAQAIFATSALISSTSLLADSAGGSAAVRVKSKEQIRCELLADCKPLPATRAWITKTGGTETDKGAIVRAQQANLASPRQSVSQPKPGKSRKSAPVIVAVRSSDLFINFASASWSIDDVAYLQAEELYAALTPLEWATHKFEISGHTDAVGSGAYNEDLSQKRAQAVVDLLVAKGVKKSQLVVKGYGFRHPIEGLDRSDGRNRRVEIAKLD